MDNQQHCLEIKTPDRVLYMSSPFANDQQQWVDAISMQVGAQAKTTDTIPLHQVGVVVNRKKKNEQNLLRLNPLPFPLLCVPLSLSLSKDCLLIDQVQKKHIVVGG